MAFDAVQALRRLRYVGRDSAGRAEMLAADAPVALDKNGDHKVDSEEHALLVQMLKVTRATLSGEHYAEVAPKASEEAKDEVRKFDADGNGGMNGDEYGAYFAGWRAESV